MASVTKTFVATSVMQLSEKGKIDLDAPVIRYLPYFKLNDERYRTITIRQMLTHTSGIPDTVNYNWDKPEYGTGKVEERDALVLEAPRAGSPRRFYFDSVNGLLLRTEEWNAAGKMTEADEYQDYREVDGVKVPFTIHIIQDAHFTINLTEVKHSVPIDDTIFVKPKK